MCPQSDLCMYVDEPEITRFRLPCCSLRLVREEDLEECIVITAMIILGPGSELLVGGHQRRSDVMCYEVSLCVNMEELNDIAVANNATLSGLWDSLSWDDLPDIIGIIVGIAGNLLAYDMLTG